MRRILVGFDGSQGSEKALLKALSLIEEGGELILLAVIPSKAEKSFVDSNAYRLARKRAHQIVQEKIREIGDTFFDVTGVVEVGDAADKIIEVANKKVCDLVILGRRGQSEISPSTLGSVAEKVVTFAYKPVMVVK